MDSRIWPLNCDISWHVRSTKIQNQSAHFISVLDFTLFYPPTLNIICFVEKQIIFFEVLSVYF